MRGGLAEAGPEDEYVPNLGGDVEPVTVDMSKQIELIDKEFESGNPNELDPELANYAKKLAANASTPEDEDAARKAIDAVLDGYTMDEFSSETALNESRKRVKNRIVNLFSD